MVAGGILWGMIGIFFFSLIIVFNLIEYANMSHIIGCSLFSGVLCYFFVFKNDKYVKHFDSYEQWSKMEKRQYCLLTMASIVAIFFLFYLGLTT